MRRLPCGPFRYSDLKVAAPAVRHLCDLNAAVDAGYSAITVFVAVVDGIGVRGARQ